MSGSDEGLDVETSDNLTIKLDKMGKALCVWNKQSFRHLDNRIRIIKYMIQQLRNRVLIIIS